MPRNPARLDPQAIGIDASLVSFRQGQSEVLEAAGGRRFSPPFPALFPGCHDCGAVDRRRLADPSARGRTCPQSKTISCMSFSVVYVATCNDFKDGGGCSIGTLSGDAVAQNFLIGANATCVTVVGLPGTALSNTLGGASIVASEVCTPWQARCRCLVYAYCMHDAGSVHSLRHAQCILICP